MTKLRKRQSPDLCVERCTPRWLASLFGRQAVRWSIKNEDIKEQLADFKKAELWADTLLDEHWNDKFPVDPNVIAVNMGMEVWLAPTSGEFAGVILKTDKQEMPSIFVDKDATTSRKRFTIAHMVGHYVEHLEDPESPDQQIPGYFGFHDESMVSDETILADRRPTDSGAPNQSQRELFADHFARSLLMPEGEFQEVIDLGLKFDDIATYFDVSTATMRNRLNDLGIDL